MYEQTEQTESSCGLVDVDRIEPDQLKRWAQWTSLGIIAVDLATGVVLKTGNGRRRAGRPARYFIWAPAAFLPAGYFDQRQIGTVTGCYDEDAIAAARKRIKKLAPIIRKLIETGERS